MALEEIEEAIQLVLESLAHQVEHKQNQARKGQLAVSGEVFFVHFAFDFEGLIVEHRFEVFENAEGFFSMIRLVFRS
ncbi:MAG: hypothetical protein IH820_02450 [Bacteroidetes bacterium]|nr:hypothetical protein [Bacteroidota bacterium]